MRLPRLTETKPRSAWKAARRRRRKKEAVPERVVEDRGALFGTVTEQIVEVRPRPRKGGRGAGDEAVIVQRQRAPNGRIKKRKVLIKPV